jgi:hypothetical protein
MAHLWIQGASGWEAQKLEGMQLDLDAILAPQVRDTKPGIRSRGARLIRADAGGSPVWALIVSRNSDIRVNGRAVLTGLCVLADRDEIRTNSEKYFFSTETLATVEEFPSMERPVFCGRCRQPIDPGSPAARCPGCSVWCHESADLPCWTYTDKCPFDGHPTALDSGFLWTPEE